jgi:hypothetical protein
MGHGIQGLAAVLALGLAVAVAGGENGSDGKPVVLKGEAAREALPERVRQFVDEKFKGCELIQTERKARVNLVLAVVMWDIYRGDERLRVEMKDAKGKPFQAEFEITGKLCKLRKVDGFTIRSADAPNLLRSAEDVYPGAEWEAQAQGREQDGGQVKYELRGRKNGKRVRVTVSGDGTVLDPQSRRSAAVEGAAVP